MGNRLVRRLTHRASLWAFLIDLDFTKLFFKCFDSEKNFVSVLIRLTHLHPSGYRDTFVSPDLGML